MREKFSRTIERLEMDRVKDSAEMQAKVDALQKALAETKQTVLRQGESLGVVVATLGVIEANPNVGDQVKITVNDSGATAIQAETFLSAAKAPEIPEVADPLIKAYAEAKTDAGRIAIIAQKLGLI